MLAAFGIVGFILCAMMIMALSRLWWRALEETILKVAQLESVYTKFYNCKLLNITNRVYISYWLIFGLISGYLLHTDSDSS